MKGKALYHIIRDLSKSEKHKVLNICKASGDKRHLHLYNLIKKNPKTEQHYQKCLSQISNKLFQQKPSTKEFKKEQDKTLRRFIDFSIKEIENQKMKDLVTNDLKTRNFLLAKIYNKPETQQLFKNYNKKSHNLAEKEKDIWLQSFLVDQGIVLMSNSQRKKDLEMLRDLILYKNNLANTIYHQKLSDVYDLLSALYLEDFHIADELEGLMLSEEEVAALVKLSKDKPEAVEYRIAQARFNFTNYKKVKHYMSSAKEGLNKTDAAKQRKDILQTRILFLEYMVAIHYGEDVKQVIRLTEKVIESNERYGYPDALTPFYHLLAHLIKDKNFKLEKGVEKYNRFFPEESSFFVEFLRAYRYFLFGDTKNALMRLNHLSYGPNFYIAVWSRLLEIKIHLKKENIHLCESLLNRANRHMLKNDGKVFTFNSSAEVLMRLSKELDMKPPKLYQNYKTTDKNLSVFHKSLI